MSGGASGAQQHIYGDLNVRQELTQIAASEQVKFIDLMQRSAAWVTSVGRTTAQTNFVGNDQTHSNELGAHVFAEMVVSGIRETGLPLAAKLR
jgi:lysophospholipase L1-like esterase